MTIEVIIKFNWTNIPRVNDSARRAIAAAVGVTVGGRKEYNFVVLANDDERNFWFKAQPVACSCGEVGRLSLGMQGTKMQQTGHTSYVVELLVKDSPEFSFGDPVCET